mmetsp:Transcript_66463/g.121124  ORF Transcript_66463/g.121124 Transcript_66463/m.121124 type:complete len:630 (+) Transcript_66463:54-1943(+)
MSSLALILACLACAGHGRRVQTTVEGLQAPANKDIDSTEIVTDTALADKGQQSSKSLAELVYTWPPSSAWQAQSPITSVKSIKPSGVHNGNSVMNNNGKSHRSGTQVIMQGPTAFHPEDFSESEYLQSVQTPNHKIAKDSVHAEASSPRSGSSTWRRAALGLFLALSGSVPAIALARQQRASWRARRGAPRASDPVLAATMAEAASGGTATVSSSIINLAKNIVGSGVLSLSAGIAAFSAAGAGVLPATALLFGLGAASAYSFALVARVGNEVGATSYADVWNKTFGESTSIIPALTVCFMTLAAGLSYSIILGDSFASIASLAGLPAIVCAPNTWILGLSACLLLPLSLLRDLSALAVGSVIGTAGTIYTALFMCLRYVDRTYAAGGKFYSVIAENARPLFSSGRPLINPAIFVLVSMLSSAFLAHYNAPKYFQELATPKDGSSKAKSFNAMVAGAFGLAAAISASIMIGGFLTFGGASQGFILNNYATSDPFAFMARIGISASIIFSYPLNFVGLREGVLNILKLDGRKNTIHIATTLILLCGMNGLSLVLKDLGLVCAVGGALLGSSLVYIFPALMFIQATRLKMKADGEQVSAARLKEMYANYGLAGLGVVLAVIGIIMSLKSAA